MILLPISASLEAVAITSLIFFILNRLQICVILDLFSLSIRPLVQISSVMSSHFHLSWLRSLVKFSYLSIFHSCAFLMDSFVSHGMVSSIIVYFLFSLFMMNMSGFCSVTMVWGGIVPPQVSQPLMSENISMFGMFWSLNLETRYFKTKLCLRVNLFCFKDTGH